MTPYPACQPNCVSARLRKLGYPAQITRLCYGQFTDCFPDRDRKFDLWLHPGQNTNVGQLRPTGHDVHRYLISENLFYLTIDFHTLNFFASNPKYIPSDWYGYCSVSAWKGLGYNLDGDLCLPSLYLKSPEPSIRWTPLAFPMHAGEATPLAHYY